MSSTRPKPCTDCGGPCYGQTTRPVCRPCYLATRTRASKQWRNCSLCGKQCRTFSGICKRCQINAPEVDTPRPEPVAREPYKIPPRRRCPICHASNRTLSGICIPCRFDESAFALTGGRWVPRPGGVLVWVADDEREAS